MEALIEIFNTVNLDDFYRFISALNIDYLISHQWIIVSVVIVSVLLFTPYKSWVATALFYSSVVTVTFFSIAIFKNSNFSPNESFVFFSVGIFLILGCCLYKFFL